MAYTNRIIPGDRLTVALLIAGSSVKQIARVRQQTPCYVSHRINAICRIFDVEGQSQLIALMCIGRKPTMVDGYGLFDEAESRLPKDKRGKI